jgi:tetratricopeptide (TPR) repeat protein
MRVTAQIGWTLFEQMKRSEGIARLLPVLRRWELDPTPTAGAAELHVALANLYWVRQVIDNEMEEALILAQRGSSLASEVGDERLLARAEGRRGTILLSLGRLEESLVVLDRAVDLAESEGDLESLSRSLNNRALAHDQLGQPDGYQADMERQLEFARRLGNPTQIGFCLGNLAALAESYGDWEEARRLFDEVLRVGRQLRNARLGDFSSRAVYHRFLAGESGAEAELETFAAKAKRSGDEGAWAHALIRLAEVDLWFGRADQALVRLETALRSPALEDRLRHQAPLARAHAALGETAKAEKTIEDAIDQLRRQRNPEFLGKALSARGTVRADQKRWAEARADFEEALTMMREGRRGPDEADALVDYGAMLRAKGDTNEARGKLEQALKLFESMGAKPAAQRTQRALAEIDAGRQT